MTPISRGARWQTRRAESKGACVINVEHIRYPRRGILPIPPAAGSPFTTVGEKCIGDKHPAPCAG